MRRGMRHPDQRPDLAHRQVRPPVRRDQQHSVGQRQRPLPTRAPVAAPLRDQPHQLAELAWLQPRERGNPLRPRRCDHLHHDMIKYHNVPHGPTLGLRDIPSGRTALRAGSWVVQGRFGGRLCPPLRRCLPLRPALCAPRAGQRAADCAPRDRRRPPGCPQEEWSCPHL